MIDKTILHYKIIEELGRGGMGVVYKAEDTRLKRFVALKFLHQQPGAEKQTIRLLREAQTAGALDHPNICTVYGFDEIDGQIFIVMAYIEGRELKSIIDDRQLSIIESINYATQIAEGLQTAHERGIIHRDIKSSNIMITEKGQVKIMDFGLARWAGNQTLVTKIGTKIGTTAYMSPEQALGRPVDHRTDIWSLAVLFYEMLSGRLPFRSENEQAVIYAILNEEPEPIRRLQPGMPVEIEEIVKKALAKNPDMRYQSVAAMLQDLYAYAPQTNIFQKRQTTNSKLSAAGLAQSSLISRFSKRILPTIGGIVLLVFIAAGIWTFANRETSSEPEKETGSQAVAVMPFSVRGSSEFAYLGEGMVDLLGSKFDGIGGLRIVDSRALLGYLSKSGSRSNAVKEPEQVLGHFQASFYIVGNILAVGRQVQLDASFYEKQKSNALATASVTGRMEEIFDMVDRLAAELLTQMNIKTGDRLKRTAVRTTGSLPALKAYLEGESAFRAGQFDAAMAAFRQAVAEDSSFALAFYRLSVAADWLTRPEISRQAAVKAVRHNERLSEHDRLLLDAMLAWRSGDAEKAERLYRAITGTYLDDIEAWFQLGEVLFHYGPLNGNSISAAREMFAGVLQIDPEHVPALWHLVRIAAVEKKYDELNNLVARIMKLQPEGERLLEILTLQAFAVDDEAARQKVLHVLRKSDDLTLALSVWDVACYTDDFSLAEPLAEIFTSPERSPEANVLGNLMLAHLRLAAGRLQQAQLAFAAAEKIDPVLTTEFAALAAISPFLKTDEVYLRNLYDRLLAAEFEHPQPYVTPNIFFNVHNRVHPYLRSYLLGMLAATLGKEKESIRFAEQLNLKIDASEELMLARDLSLSIRAQVAFKAKKSGKALQYLGQLHKLTWYGLLAASPFYSRAYQRFLHAEILFETGSYEDALKLYRSFSQYSVYDLAYHAHALFRQGQIHEKLGEYREAVDSFSAFIAIWQNCDSELRDRVEEAKQRINLLKKKVYTAMDETHE